LWFFVFVLTRHFSQYQCLGEEGSNNKRRGRVKHSTTSHPYRAARNGKNEDRRGDDDDTTTIFTVVKTTQVKSLAGAIAHRAREGQPPVLTALGPRAVNQAVKAIAIANDFVQEDGFRLVGHAKRVVNRERDLRDLFRITITKAEDAAEWQDTSLEAANPNPRVELKCASGSDPEAVAAAIRNKIGGIETASGNRRLRVTSIGPVAVFKTVDALSRTERADLRFLPEFREVELDGVNITGMDFHVVLSHQNSTALIGRRQSVVDHGRRRTFQKALENLPIAKEMSIQSERFRVTVSKSSRVNVLAG
jgi:stage V sporulation protein SpoVS